MATKTVGILALQGNFSMHAKACESLGVHVLFVKKPEDMNAIDGLILPGGESTVMLKHFEQNPAWWQAFSTFHAQNKPLFGTCAGLILLAKTVIPAQKSLGFLNVTVERNAYGRQLDSHAVESEVTLNGQIHHLYLPFIRAPKITAIGDGVSVLARVNDEIVIVQQGSVLGAACHPEATTFLIHAYFVSLLEL